VSTTEKATIPALTNDEIVILNAARTILKRLSYDGTGYETFAAGRITAAARTAEWIVFEVLNTYNVWGNASLTEAQLHGDHTLTEEVDHA